MSTHPPERRLLASFFAGAVTAALLLGVTLSVRTADASRYEDLSLFTHVLSLVRGSYVETVDEHEHAATHLGEHARGMLQRRRCGVRKALVELADPDRPATLAQAFRHASVVEGAAGPGIEPSGNDEHH